MGRLSMRFCSPKCRRRAWELRHREPRGVDAAVDLLTLLPDAEFRDLLRRVCAEREVRAARAAVRPQRLRGRLRVRWGTTLSGV